MRPSVVLMILKEVVRQQMQRLCDSGHSRGAADGRDSEAKAVAVVCSSKWSLASLTAAIFDLLAALIARRTDDFRTKCLR
jgi:hypothetical protein